MNVWLIHSWVLYKGCWLAHNFDVSSSAAVLSALNTLVAQTLDSHTSKHQHHGLINSSSSSFRAKGSFTNDHWGRHNRQFSRRSDSCHPTRARPVVERHIQALSEGHHVLFCHITRRHHGRLRYQPYGQLLPLPLLQESLR